MTHKNKSVEELFEVFKGTTRQAVSALLKNNADDADFVERINKAKKMLKNWKRSGNPVINSEPFISSRWSLLLQRCRESSCTRDETFSCPYKFFSWLKSQNCFEEAKGSPLMWDIRKDILVKGNTHYSVETCFLVPREVGGFFSQINESRRGEFKIGVTLNKVNGKYIAQMAQGMRKYIGQYDTEDEAFLAYKLAKEALGKKLAEKWRGKIDHKVINALENFVVQDSHID